MEQVQMPHRLTLDGRNMLTMTGVTEVVSFTDLTVELRTTQGTLVIQGQGLQLKELSLEGGQIEVNGQVSALIYEEEAPVKGWLSRLLG